MLRTIIAAAFLALACSDGGTDPAAGAGARVLFIGNSLTEWNDMPAMVHAVSESAGVPLVTGMVAVGGFALEDHWSSGDARAAVASGRWDYVVLQQGPSALPESRANLREWTVRWAQAIRAAGAEPVVYMPWPESWRATAFDSVSTSYREAAAAANAILIPGGDAWRAAWRREPSLALYGGDGFHPSPLGSYVVAVAAWARLTSSAPSRAPAQVRGVAMDEATARVVRESVAEVLSAPAR